MFFKQTLAHTVVKVVIMSRQVFVILLVLSLLGLWRSQDLLVEAQPSQGVRVFDNVCEDCVVSDLTGFAIFPTDCTCFYTCLFVGTVKLSSMASQYVAFKKCCPCGTSFSLKSMTCVDYRNKLSTCFDLDQNETNPCNESAAGDLVPRTNPFDVPSDYCKGYNLCEDVGGVIVPNPTCCEEDTCFNGTACTTEACDSNNSCSDLTEREREDNCVCEQTDAPPSECPYMAVESSIFQFMGVDHMVIYNCSHGLCWDQDVCACVQASNNVSTDCKEILTVNLTGGEFNPMDGKGHQVWAITNNINLTEVGAFFNEADAYINVAGLAGIYLGKTLVVHIEFEPTENNSSSANTIQCLLGNCFEADPSDNGTDTISVLLERNNDSDVTNVVISITYQDTAFMSSAESMETVELEINGTYATDVQHELWIIFCGQEDEVAAGVYTGGVLVESDNATVTNVQQIIMQQSGFVFGHCPSGEDYEGLISLVEIYTCKPVDDLVFRNVSSDLGIRL